MCGQSKAAAVQQAFQKAMRSCEEQRQRSQVARDKLSELTASKEDQSSRLFALKLRLSKIIFSRQCQRDDGKIERADLIQLLVELLDGTGFGPQIHHLVNAFPSNGEAVLFDAFVDWVAGGSAP